MIFTKTIVNEIQTRTVLKRPFSWKFYLAGRMNELAALQSPPSSKNPVCASSCHMLYLSCHGSIFFPSHNFLWLLKTLLSIMPQVSQIQLLGPRSASLPSLFPFQNRERFDPMQTEATAESQVCHNDIPQQTNSPMDGVRGKPLASKEDDVQIIFCAPRRKKKRRRRYVPIPIIFDH